MRLLKLFLIINFLIFLIFFFLIIFLPYNISKTLSNNVDIKNYNANFLTNFNQLDPRHWVILSTKENKKKGIYLINALKIAPRESNYFNSIKFIYFQSLDSLDQNTIDKINDILSKI